MEAGGVSFMHTIESGPRPLENLLENMKGHKTDKHFGNFVFFNVLAISFLFLHRSILTLFLSPSSSSRVVVSMFAQIFRDDRGGPRPARRHDDLGDSQRHGLGHPNAPP